MRKQMFVLIVLFLSLVVYSAGYGQDPDRYPIIVEAESGALGSEFNNLQSGDAQYITISTDYDETSGTANYPGENRTASYDVTFPDTGTYDIFVRVLVGFGGYNDDSFFYGNGFGEKNSTNANDWILSNGLASAGFSNSDDVVRDPGGQGSNVWKWINLSRNAYQAESRDFTIDNPDDLTRNFSIGARENGLDIDKFAFGKSKLYFTVENLDSVQAGSLTDPTDIFEPPAREPLAQGKSKYFGNVWSQSQLYRFTEYWNQVIPGNPGKWGSVEGTRDNMNWGPLDAAYALAKDNGFPYRHHVLIWGNQQPEWIETLPPEEQLEEIEEWFAAVAERYPEIDVLEVVNEPLHDPPNQNDNGGGNYINALGGNNDLYGTGWDWVIKAFELAKEYFPASTMLILNDYSIPNSTSTTTAYLEIVNILLGRDLIDGIGVQGHAFSTRGSMSTVSSNLDRLAETSLSIIVTEMNIDGGSGTGVNAPTEEDQLNEYMRIFPTFWEHPGVVGISLSGWRPGMGNSEAILINTNGSERPAMEWLSAYVDTANGEASSSVKRLASLPDEFYVFDNYPNPFNPVTTIKYSVPLQSRIRITIYNALGREIRSLVDEIKQPGQYEIMWDGRDSTGSAVTSGLYFCRIENGESSRMIKLTLLK
ncbi:endo-1,4-beta-xylanase [candidate division KSB1 bacterium]|nr:endo-1,4-beta-xylanase [candidate division KSB1 bacterium]